MGMKQLLRAVLTKKTKKVIGITNLNPQHNDEKFGRSKNTVVSTMIATREFCA